ncbi:hypothetical protein CKO28_00305 [Rhodovibrio sodomensis]|uniref:Uncharacterized protein n=1 Tax=Rhodovibrio sodomensis TaxID=1088 RepID=A0ABS1D7U4_9PROT|nr:hypothetical protein [Rhodovibrio sodomensis]MBK1666481.1 hypothetical protein [Rhodovibrio sodomensis]
MSAPAPREAADAARPLPPQDVIERYLSQDCHFLAHAIATLTGAELGAVVAEPEPAGDRPRDLRHLVVLAGPPDSPMDQVLDILGMAPAAELLDTDSLPDARIVALNAAELNWIDQLVARDPARAEMAAVHRDAWLAEEISLLRERLSERT